MPQALVQIGKSEIYRRSGIQFLPFNTIYQLRALTKQQPELTAQVAHALLMPDYFSYRLTGEMNWEYTNATTTSWSISIPMTGTIPCWRGLARKELVRSPLAPRQCYRRLDLPAGQPYSGGSRRQPRYRQRRYCLSAGK